MRTKDIRREIVERALTKCLDVYVSLDRRLKHHIQSLEYFREVRGLDLVKYLLALLLLDRQLVSTIHNISRRITLMAEYVEECGREILPPVLPQLLPYTYPRGLAAYTRIEVTLNTPENIFLKVALIRVLRETKKLMESLRREIGNRPWIKLLLKELVSSLNRVYFVLRHSWVKYVELDPRGRRATKIDGKNRVFEELKRRVKARIARGLAPRTYQAFVKLYEEYEDLQENLRVGMKKAEELEKKTGYLVNPSRVYEVYTLMLIIDLLREELDEGRSIIVKDGKDTTYFIATIRGEEVRVAFNQLDELQCKSRLYSVKLLKERDPDNGEGKDSDSGEEKCPSSVTMYYGLPDFIIKRGEKTVLLECKLRFSASSLTESRYKVLGYMHEYNVGQAVLVFPRIVNRGSDQEEGATHKLFEDAQKGGVVLLYRDEPAEVLAIVSVDPARYEDLEKSVQTDKENLRKVLGYLGIL